MTRLADAKQRESAVERRVIQRVNGGRERVSELRDRFDAE